MTLARCAGVRHRDPDSRTC